MFSYSINCTGCGRKVVGKVSTCFKCATEGPPAKPIFTQSFIKGTTFASIITSGNLSPDGVYGRLFWNGVSWQQDTLIINNE